MRDKFLPVIVGRVMHDVMTVLGLGGDSLLADN